MLDARAVNKFNVVHKYNFLEFNHHSQPTLQSLLLKSSSVFAGDTKSLFACDFPHWYQRLNGKRADQVLSVLDKLINVSQFIIRALSSPCQVANGNINHRLPHHDPSHIFASHLASVDSSSRNTTKAQTDLSGTNVKHNSAQE